MKNALIIGGSSGIGFDTAQRLASRNVAVTITGRNLAKLNQAAAVLKQAGSEDSASNVAARSVWTSWSASAPATPVRHVNLSLCRRLENMWET